jgi:hypothetical protein
MQEFRRLLWGWLMFGVYRTCMRGLRGVMSGRINGGYEIPWGRTRGDGDCFRRDVRV